jgi:hypothetical protein
VRGGVVWGIGAALREQSLVDPRYGGFLNSTMEEYPVAVNADIGEIDVSFIDEPDPLINPVGVKRPGRSVDGGGRRRHRQRRLPRNRHTLPPPAHPHRGRTGKRRGMTTETIPPTARTSSPLAGSSADAFPDRPPISAPPDTEDRADREFEAQIEGQQPAIGLAGITRVVPVAIALGVGAGGLESSLRILGPLSTFALPVVAMIAFWWEDWPGTKFRAPLSGLFDTILVIVGGVLLTLLGQLVVGRADPTGVFSASPRTGAAPTFPATMSLGGAFFVAMRQITLVNEGWPLRRLGRTASGPIALTVSWAVALTLYLALVRTHPTPDNGLYPRLHGPLTGPQLGAVLISVGFWQALFYVGLRGWPFTGLHARGARLPIANLTVVTLGVATYLILHATIGLPAQTVTAVVGTVLTSVLLQGMLFSGLPRIPGRAGVERLASLGVVAVPSAALYAALTAVAHPVRWTAATPQEWVGYATLDAIGLGVITHVGIGRRWPLARVTDDESPASRRG